MSSTLHEYLLRACDVVERGSITEELRRVLFIEGRLRAFNGMLEYQAPSGIDAAEEFSLSEAKLANALRACGEELTMSSLPDFIRFRKGPFSVRVRKMPTDKLHYDRISLPVEAKEQSAAGLLEALRAIRDFISTDASRSWSVSALLKDGYAWATNNMALVRTPIPASFPLMRIPIAAVHFLCELKSIDYWHVDPNGRLVFVSGKQLMRCPQAMGEWPDVAAFFKDFPAELAPVPAEMLSAATMVKKFAERFITLSASSMKSSEEAIESEYEVEFSKGAGKYSAPLLALILAHATHADFSFYPKPAYFKGALIEGVAIGAQQA